MYDALEIKEHSLCLDDFNVSGTELDLQGRNLIDLLFAAGDLKKIYGQLQKFNFSNNPKLKIS